MATVRNILLNVAGQTGQAQRAVHDLSEEVRQIPNETTFEIGADITKARDRIGTIRGELRKIDRTQVSPEVNVEITKALVRLDELEARLRKLPRKGTIDFDVRRGILTELAAVEQGVVRTTSALKTATAPAQTFGDVAHAAGQKVKQLTPIVNGLAIILITKLLPGLIALAGTAVAAAGAVGGLAAAFAGALVPSVALAIPVFSRFGKVLEALRLQHLARDAAAAAALEGSHAAAAAADARRQAAIAERDALEGLETAERNLGNAVAAAAKARDDADRAHAEAQRAAAASADALKRAEVDAYREMEDAAERARDAVLAVEQAQLGVEQASIGVRRAELALREFREEAGASAKALQLVFDKFTDVDADMGGLANAIREASGGNLDEEQRLDLEQLILDVRNAKLQEKEATDALGDSETELKRAREDNVAFQREGINASESYTAAVEANRNAQDQLAQSTREMRDLEKQGIANAPQVVAAVEAIRDAEQRLDEARRNRRQQAKTGGAGAQDDAARVALAKLSATEQITLGILGRVRDFLSNQFQPAVDTVFQGIIAVLLSAPLLAVALRDKIAAIGDAWRDVLTAFSGELISVDNVLDMRNLADGAADLARILGADAFISFIRIMRNLAVLFLPALVGLSRDFADSIRGWSGEIGKGGNNTKWVAPLVGSFRAVVRFIVAGARALAEFGRVVGPIGADFLDWITGLVDEFREWISSAEGAKDIRKFFEDTIPAVKSTIKFILRLVRIFLKFFQLTAPLLKGMIDAFDFLASIIERVLDLLNFVVSNPVGRFIRELIGSFIGFGGVLRLIGRVVDVLGLFVARLGGLPGLVRTALNFVVAPFTRAGALIIRVFTRLAPNAAAAIGRVIARIISVARGAIGRLVTIGGRLIGGLIRGITSGIGAAAGIAGRFIGRLAAGFAGIVVRIVGLGGRVLGTILRGIREGFTRLPGLVGDLVGAIGRAVTGAARSIFNVGKSLLSGLIDGFTTIGREVFDAIKGLGKKIVDAVKDVLGIHSPSRVMFELGQFMLQGLIDGFTSKNVADFIRNSLGGIKDLAVDLALSATPLGPLRGPLKGLQDALGVDIPLLAKGGLAVGPTLAGIGEGAYREAVLPLSRRVMRQLAAAITAQMSSFTGPGALGSSRALTPAGAGAGPGGGDGGVHLHGDVVVKSPAGEQPDARVVGVKIERELRARGGGVR